MKKPVIIISSVIFILATFLIVFASNNGFRSCDLTKDRVCFDKELDQFKLEENATLTLNVKSIEYGEAIKQLWSTVHPEANALNYSVTNELSADLMYLTQNDAAVQYNELYIINENIVNPVPQLSSELNLAGLKYIPMVGEGFAFVSNKTEVERLLGNWIDENKNNLHDSLESYETIMKAQVNWQTDKRKMVMSLSEPFTLYPLFTADGWKLFDAYSSYYPGFEKDNFLSSLTFIEQLSTINWNQTETNDASNYTWDYPNVLYQDSFVFSQVSSWMFYDEMNLKHDSEWVISVFPKAYETSEKGLSSLLTEVYGYSINANTVYPSAAHELLRLIVSIEGLQLKVDNEDVILLNTLENLALLNFKHESIKQFSEAFVNSQSEPLIAIEDYPSHLAMNLFYDINIEKVIQKLWNKEITVHEAQIEIALLADQWIMENSKLFEGKLTNE